MSLTAAVWFVILCALVMANLPFLLERRLAPWPWARGDGADGLPGVARWGLAVLFLGLLALWAWATVDLVGGSFAGGGADSALFLLKLLLSLLMAAVLLALAGRRRAGTKSFLDRFLEVLIGYALVGTLGFALELNQGNAFAQGWEFYAVTLALFLVLGYPGFVWRYMLRRRTA